MRENSMQRQKDQEALRKLGYIQELDRSMGLFTNFAIAFSLISALTGISFLYDYGLQYAGLASLSLLPIVGIFQLLVALSLSEIAAVYPVAGGVYKWTTILSNKTAGWFSGMIALAGWSACGIGVAYGLTQFLIALFGIPSANKIMFLTIMGLIIFLYSVLNLCGMKLVKWFCHASVVIHIIGILIIATLLFVFGRHGSIPDLSLGSMFQSADWQGTLSTILLSAWVFTGFDASANVSEESLNPSVTVPSGIMLSVGVSYLLGNLFLFSLGYVTISAATVAASGQPAVVYVVSQVLGPVVSKYIFLIIIIAMFICGLAKQTLIVRMIYALARDNALPKSNILKVVSTTYEVPNYSVVIAGAMITAASVFTVMLPFDPIPLLVSVSVLGICLSHAITIAASFHHLVRYNVKFFKFKAVSLAIRIISVAWLIFICITVCFFNIYGMMIMTVMITLFLIYYLADLKNSNYYDNSITLTEEDLIRIENMRRGCREEKA